MDDKNVLLLGNKLRSKNSARLSHCAKQIFRPSLFLSTYQDCQIQRNTAEFSCIATILLCLLQCVGSVAGRNIEAMGSACSEFEAVTGLVTGFQQHSATSGHELDIGNTINF